MMSLLRDLFPDAPDWMIHLAWLPLSVLFVAIILALFPSPLERLLHGRDEHEGAELPGRGASRGRHHEGKTPALAAHQEASGDGDAASTVRLGSSVTS
jgi:hypothetical protein